ncbi:MAG: hypothetical protein AB7F64_03215 [Gammaproteobacteria bacterium]
MKKGFLLFFLLLGLTRASFADNYTLCKGEFALCTKAMCTPIPGGKDVVACKCIVLNGYSAGSKPCQKVQKTKEGLMVVSRYSPIKAYVPCTNNRPWAWCFDSPCIVDKNDPSKAVCKCPVVQNKGEYLIVTDHFTKTTCTKGLYSSALISQLNDVTNFLKQHIELPPYPIKVHQGD